MTPVTFKAIQKQGRVGEPLGVVNLPSAHRKAKPMIKQTRAVIGSVVFAGAMLGVTAVAEAASFTNGSFEIGTLINTATFDSLSSGDSTSIPGWLVGGIYPAGVDYIGGYWQPGAGDRSIDLSGSTQGDGQMWGSIAQTFDTTPGQTYQVSFLLAGNPDNGPTVKTVDLFVDLTSYGTRTFDVTGKTRSNMGWVTESFLFTAVSNSETITFRSDPTDNNTFFGPALDNVSVTAVPLPAALPLFASGLAGLGWLGRRRRKQFQAA